jgi:activator of HSP90 ATPase
MKTDSIKVTAVMPADPKAVFGAWMSSAGHAGMTGSAAKIGARAGSKFSAWDGYISGKTLELDPPRRILQSWRTTDFAQGDPDSTLEVLLERAKGGTKVTLVHTNIPAGHGGEYRKGWLDFYFKPMKGWFAGQG